MKLSDITPVILTYNEESNILRCLSGLRSYPVVIVVDSFSSDRTVERCLEFANVVVVKRPFDNHTAQWNFGIGCARTEWILALDADYIISDAFHDEISKLEAGKEAAFYASFRYCIYGHRLRGSLYPDRAVLFRKGDCKYRQDGHTQLLEIRGDSGKIRSAIDHDDRKPLQMWLESQRKYVVLEADKMLSENIRPRSLPDRLRSMIWPAPLAAMIYTLFVNRLILDGWPGIYYVLQRTYAEILLSLELLERRLRADDQVDRVEQNKLGDERPIAKEALKSLDRRGTH